MSDELFDRILKANPEELKKIRKALEERAAAEGSAPDPEERPEITAKPEKRSRHNFTPTERITLDYQGKF